MHKITRRDILECLNLRRCVPHAFLIVIYLFSTAVLHSAGSSATATAPGDQGDDPSRTAGSRSTTSRGHHVVHEGTTFSTPGSHRTPGDDSVIGVHGSTSPFRGAVRRRATGSGSRDHSIVGSPQRVLVMDGPGGDDDDVHLSVSQVGGEDDDDDDEAQYTAEQEAGAKTYIQGLVGERSFADVVIEWSPNVTEEMLSNAGIVMFSYGEEDDDGVFQIDPEADPTICAAVWRIYINASPVLMERFNDEGNADCAEKVFDKLAVLLDGSLTTQMAGQAGQYLSILRTDVLGEMVNIVENIAVLNRFVQEKFSQEQRGPVQAGAAAGQLPPVFPQDSSGHHPLPNNLPQDIAGQQRPYWLVQELAAMPANQVDQPWVVHDLAGQPARQIRIVRYDPVAQRALIDDAAAHRARQNRRWYQRLYHYLIEPLSDPAVWGTVAAGGIVFMLKCTAKK